MVPGTNMVDDVFVDNPKDADKVHEYKKFEGKRSIREDEDGYLELRKMDKRT